MSSARHTLALLRSHVAGDDREFLATAMQVAAREAQLGHQRVAEEIRGLITQAKQKAGQSRGADLLVMRERQDLAGLVSVSEPSVRLSSLVLADETRARLDRIVHEQRQRGRLRERGLQPRRKLLLVGPPGTGKTMTATALAGELHLPLLTILLEGVINKFMGETASKMRLIFEAMAGTPGVYLFDEFDAIGAKRNQTNDVGEIRRVLNSFLQMMDADDSAGPIVAATNHPELLDVALFRRFDDVIRYELPTIEDAVLLLRTRLAPFRTEPVHFAEIGAEAAGLSHAEITRAADEAAKQAVLGGTEVVAQPDLVGALRERRQTYHPNREPSA